MTILPLYNTSTKTQNDCYVFPPLPKTHHRLLEANSKVARPKKINLQFAKWISKARNEWMSMNTPPPALPSFLPLFLKEAKCSLSSSHLKWRFRNICRIFLLFLFFFSYFSPLANRGINVCRGKKISFSCWSLIERTRETLRKYGVIDFMIGFGLRPSIFLFVLRYCIVLVLACSLHKMLMTKSSECVRQTIFFFSLFDFFRTPIRKDPEINSRGELISFYAELSLSLPVPAFYCIYFMLVLPVFNVVDNGQLNLGKE